ncbi:MAG: winged helix-turn-helix domain-containing protein [Acidobacteria bacterium]|nr:winged helix-turn-helix domain-containing protein [Acidobacteriota bacterium]
MNYLEAATKIIEESGKPLTCREIVDIALERKLIEPQGSDPATVLNSLIMQDLKLKGLRSEFSRIGTGVTLRRLIYKNAIDPEPARERDPQPPWDPQREPPRETTREREPRRERDRERPKAGGRRARSTEKEWKNAKPGRKPVANERRAKPDAAPRPVRPVVEDELWGAVKQLGMASGYRAFPIGLSGGTARAMGWYDDRNPEIALVLCDEGEGADLEAALEELVKRNFHKVVLVAGKGSPAALEEKVSGSPWLGKLSIVAGDLLLERANSGVLFLEFFRQLRDCRPLGEHREIRIG